MQFSRAGLDFLLSGQFYNAVGQRLTCRFLSDRDEDNFFPLEKYQHYSLLSFWTLPVLYLIKPSYLNSASQIYFKLVLMCYQFPP